MTLIQAAVTFLVAALAAGSGFLVAKVQVRGTDRATRQREVAARSAQWFIRYKYAAELITTGNHEQRTLGFQIAAVLVESDLAGPEEAMLAAILTEKVLRSRLLLLTDRVPEEAAEGGEDSGRAG